MKTDKYSKVIDLFAGAGGFGLGFQLAGYEVVCSLEIDQWAAESLRINSPEMLLIQDDIRKYRSEDDIRQVYNNTVHVVIGGPPCQGYSIAGPAKKDPKDPRNTLFIDFARWVGYLRPQVFIMENVKGILSRRTLEGGKVVAIIREAFTKLGLAYTVEEPWQLNAAQYGVPQMRERVFIVGNRLGINKIGPPAATHYISDQENNQQLTSLLSSRSHLLPACTVSDAISDLPELRAGGGTTEQAYTSEPQTEYQRWARGRQEILFNHVAMKHTKRMVERFKHISCGESGLDAPRRYAARRRNGNGELSKSPYNSNNRRLHSNRPSYTIPASFYSSFIHPSQHRNLTAREAARIQSFPDRYRFMGKRTLVSRKLLARQGRPESGYLSQYNQIGNAVPPLLAKAIAEHIRGFLDT